MQELAVMLRNAQQAAARAPLVADESKKWLQWDDFLCFVQALRAECAGAHAQMTAQSARLCMFHSFSVNT
jgi:competence protein ComGF